MPTPIKMPVALAELKGADKQNPQRYRKAKKVVHPEGDIGDPPLHLTNGAMEVWNEVVPIMLKGVLTVADRIGWCNFCELVAEHRSDPRNFPAAKHTIILSYLARFGMTPADRVKIQIQQIDDKPQNPFSEFAA
jgi:hypothetical protein